MRTILAMCALILVVGGFLVWRSIQLPDRFGEFTGAQEVAVEDLITHPQEFTGKLIFVRGTVKEQCQTMGCYFFFPTPNGKLRVELKDIAMDAPMREGRPARVEGQIVPSTDGYQLYASAVAFE
jgi:hypothetical protein